ncbi:MAG: tRNA lysidine(34) synthetase TilS [Pseudomonadota bacterium]
MNDDDPSLIRTVLEALPPHLRRRPLLLALSGGLDSTVLLHILARMHDAGLIAPLRAVHVHHGLHPDADDWAAHASQAAAALGVVCDVHRIRLEATDRRGLEAAARALRYAALHARMDQGSVLLTAHHRDDQAETLLHQLMRGAGVRGMAAMPDLKPVETPRGLAWHARPLLGVTRDSIHVYAQAHGLRWVDDPSNVDTCHARNHLRCHVMPALREHWPQADATLARAAKRMAATEGLLNDLARIDLATARTERNSVLAADALRRLSNERLANAIRYWCLEQGLPTPPQARLDSLPRMLRSRRDAMTELRWAGMALRGWRQHLYLLKHPIPLLPDDLAILWDGAAPLHLPEAALCIHGEQDRGEGIRLDILRGRVLEVRARPQGARLRIKDRPMHRTVKALLQELDIPPWQRARLPFFYVDGVLAQIGDLVTADDFAARDDEPSLRIRLEDV